MKIKNPAKLAGFSGSKIFYIRRFYQILEEIPSLIFTDNLLVIGNIYFQPLFIVLGRKRGPGIKVGKDNVCYGEAMRHAVQNLLIIRPAHI